MYPEEEIKTSITIYKWISDNIVEVEIKHDSLSFEFSCEGITEARKIISAIQKCSVEVKKVNDDGMII